MATAKIFPKTSQVSGTHSNMPLLLVPSEVTDIGSLSLAEAESIRIYTDSSLTTEVAREVVSADEIHFKAPSVSSSMEFWVDWDGVRSDYAVGATYGRNAVWSDYEYVSHDGGGTDSTGNWTPTANGGVTAGGSTGKIGDATDFDGINDSFTVGDIDTNSFTIQAWATVDSIRNQYIVSKYIGSTPTRSWILRYDDSNWEFDVIQAGGAFAVAEWAQTPTANQFYYVVGVFDDTNNDAFLYVDGVERATSSPTSVQQTNTDVVVGSHGNGSAAWDGDIDEVRLTSSVLSSDRISDEYNNQNGAFWDSDPVGSGGAVLPQFLGFAGL